MAETIRKPYPGGKVAIVDILEARTVPKEDGPDVLLTRYGEMGRVNVIAAIVDAQEGNALLLDDGSGRILVRSFEERQSVGIGDVVLCIARPQFFQQEWYLVPEVLKKIEPAWLRVRKKELGARKVLLMTVEEVPHVRKTDADQKEADAVLENPLEMRVVKLVKQEDAGDGAEEEKIIAQLQHPMTEQMIQKMILRGDLFYAKPGRLKVLE